MASDDMLLELLLENTERDLNIDIVKDIKNEPWGKSLENMPNVTINEIENHRKKSGKSQSIAIIKTLDRGRKFKNERYISADSIFTRFYLGFFYVKCKCKASMKKEFRTVELVFNTNDADYGINAKCDCPAGASGYCNHIMALLFELADYTLSGLLQVPEEVSCTSKSRQWGIPSESRAFKNPVMLSSVYANSDKGIDCTLYNPRRKKCDAEDVKIFKEKLLEKDQRIGFANCLDLSRSDTSTSRYGKFLVGSPLSYQLAVVESNVLLITNIDEIENDLNLSDLPSVDKIRLPLKLLPEEFVPKNWEKLTYREMMFLETLRIENIHEAKDVEFRTVEQANCPDWFEKRKSRITSSKAHDIFTRKKSFEILAQHLTTKKQDEELPEFTREALKHGKMYEAPARKLYKNCLQYKMKHEITVRQTGLVIQPYLFWLAASPDGCVVDKTTGGIGLIEIKCPKTKRNCKPLELCNDPKFYVELIDRKPSLKKNHPYYTQIQMAMGLSCAKFCDFIVYTFEGLIVIRIDFDDLYFRSLLEKLNNFYKHYLLPIFS